MFRLAFPFATGLVVTRLPLRRRGAAAGVSSGSGPPPVSSVRFPAAAPGFRARVRVAAVIVGASVCVASHAAFPLSSVVGVGLVAVVVVPPCVVSVTF